MVYETPYDPSVRQHTEGEDDSEGEDNDNAEMIRESASSFHCAAVGVRN